jgi:mRNA interferase MazF
MPPVGRVVGPEQDFEPKAVNPESLGGTQITARPGNTQVTCRQRLHCPILAVNASRRNTTTTTIATVITSNTALAAMPGNVFLPAAVSGLPDDSVVNVTALVTLDKTGLETPVGHLPASPMNDVDRVLRRVLGL